MGIWGSHGGTIIYISSSSVKTSEREWGRGIFCQLSQAKSARTVGRCGTPQSRTAGEDCRSCESGNPKRNHKRLGTSRNRSSEYELFPVQPKKTVSIVGIATVEVCGLTIKGVTVKQGQDGLFCNLPQYYSEKDGYRDVIRPTSKRIREAITEAVLQEYEAQKSRGLKT